MVALLVMTNVDVTPSAAKNESSQSSGGTWKTSAAFITTGPSFNLQMTLNLWIKYLKELAPGTQKDEFSHKSSGRQAIHPPYGDGFPPL